MGIVIAKDANGFGFPVVAFDGDPNNIAVDGTPRSVNVPAGSTVVRLSSTVDCYIKYGASAADTNDHLFPAGVEYVQVPDGTTAFNAVWVDTAGVLSVAKVK